MVLLRWHLGVVSKHFTSNLIRSDMKHLNKLQRIPVIGVVVRKIIGLLASNNANNISKHFSQFLQPHIANTEELKLQVFRLRHKVYCEELKFEDEKPNQLEQDDFDAHSIHCYVKHVSSGNMAGTVRLISSSCDDEQLPIEKYCLHSITDHDFSPRAFPRDKICEISRLAVLEQFRRREQDKFSGAATGAINVDTYSGTELRCFPYIALCLYFSAASTAFHAKKEHAFVMMEPRLARSLAFVGIKFHQIGPVIDYHGRRAPFYINKPMLFDGLSPGFKKLLFEIEKSLANSVQVEANSSSETSDYQELQSDVVSR
jgi:N-acyl amino acid synthase of PEP-CTERM/exosortase system